MKNIALLISCEHGVNTIPAIYQDLFAAHQDLLNTHRGIDFGSLALAGSLAENFPCDFVQAKASRLLIDCNRRLNSPSCFSEISETLSMQDKQQIIQEYYVPYRRQIENIIQGHLEQKQQVWHLSIHSFTPILHGLTRTTDIGLLYDPKRRIEKNFALQLKTVIGQQKPCFKVRMNYPYLGISDGFTTQLRRKHTENYLGIEIEVNQAIALNPEKFAALKKVFVLSLQEILKP